MDAAHNPLAPDGDNFNPNESTIDKSHILRQMIFLLESVKNHNEEKNAKLNDEQLELNEQKEIDACCLLWDVSTQQELAQLLYDHHIIPVLSQILAMRHSSRLLEVSTGIIGNIVAFDNIALDITQNNETIHKILVHLLLTSEDTPVLTEIFRTLSVLTSKAATRDIWLDRLDEEPILSHVLFVLPHTRDETLCDKMLLLLINMTWYSESVTEKLKNLNIVVTLAGAIDRKVQSNDGYFVNHCASYLENLLRVIEILSAKAAFDRALASDDRITSNISKLIKLSDSLNIITSCCICIINLDADYNSIYTAKDDFLVSALITNLSRDDTTSDFVSNVWSLFQLILTVIQLHGLKEYEKTLNMFAQNTQRLIQSLKDIEIDEQLHDTIKLMVKLFKATGNNQAADEISKLLQ
jgi:hypothetical protein